jgi:two-component system alkaline phosphatase synthesis response regulator PhoP
MERGYADPQRVIERILIADDSPEALRVLGAGLRLLGYEVDEVASGEEALTKLATQRYDLLVLYLRTSGMGSGYVIRVAGKMHPKLGTVDLSGYTTLERAIVAIKAEAAHQFRNALNYNEIINTVARVLEIESSSSADREEASDGRVVSVPKVEKKPAFVAANSATIDSNKIVVDGVTLVRALRSVTFAEEPERMVEITQGEAAVLTSLMSMPNRVLSCEQLAKASWGYNLIASEAQSVIRPTISRLRQKLESDPRKPRLIQTVRGRGYMFTPERQDRTFPAKYSS